MVTSKQTALIRKPSAPALPGIFRNKGGILMGLALVGLLTLTGCVSTLSWDDLFKDHPPTGKISTMAAKWESRVFSAPDIARQGQPGPCLAGRLYLFGPEIGTPLAGNGHVKVDMLVEGIVNEQGQPVIAPGCGKKILWETWNFSEDVLKIGLRKDIIGWGYTILLPWGNYHPAINNVELVVTYTPQEGIPMYRRTLLRLEREIRPYSHTTEKQTMKPTITKGPKR